MGVRASAWPAGTPCWVDLRTDVPRAEAFYGELFGWEFGDPGVGGYRVVTKSGYRVAGVGPGGPSEWVTYLASDDVEAGLLAVVEAGGRVVEERAVMGEQGVVGVAGDPVGGVFGLWESGRNTGIDVVDEHGAVAWNEHISGEFSVVKGFYGEVFGYGFAEVEGEGLYCALEVVGAERPVGGIGEGEGRGWVTYFQVDDADAAVVKVRELGGVVVGEVEETPWGRMASVRDDQGSHFCVLGIAPEA